MQGRYRISSLAFAVVSLLFLVGGSALATDDVAAARSLFEKNLHAIRDKDRDAYLPCYLESDHLVRTGPDGFQLGYSGLAATAGEGWPDHIDAEDLRLTPLRPGLVYGTYRYRVRYGKDESLRHLGAAVRRDAAGLEDRVDHRLCRRARRAAAAARASSAPRWWTAPAPLRCPTRWSSCATGKIDCAGSALRLSGPCGRRHGRSAGTWITPGLIDAHVHFSQTGWADGRPDALDVARPPSL